MSTERQPIVTPRLTLRAFRPDDAGDLYDYLSNAQVYQFEPGAPLDREQAGQMAADLAGSADFWAVTLPAQHKVIGQLYFKQIEPPHLLTWELGYILSPAFQRQGYGAEAAAALVNHAFQAEPIHRIVANCNPNNIASWKLLERIGFRREGLLRQSVYFRLDAAGEPLWTDTFVYAMLRTEELAANQ
jgi:RimJ/RimL family protein N-acetyltransferase